MPDVLSVTAVEIGHPMAFVILMKTHDPSRDGYR